MEPGTFAGLRVSSAPAVSSVIPRGDLCRRQSWPKELPFLPFPPGASGRGAELPLAAERKPQPRGDHSQNKIDGTCWEHGPRVAIDGHSFKILLTGDKSP